MLKTPVDLMEDPSKIRARRVFITGLCVVVVGVVALLVRGGSGLPRLVDTAPRTARVIEYLQDPGKYKEWRVDAGEKCGSAPFLMPTNGLIGFIWDDSFYPGHRHQGLDIFGGADNGKTPVYAVYDGYLTRLDNWKSSVIMRVPADPLQAGRQIWLYYTHTAAADGGDSYVAVDFPPGTQELFVKAGTMLGYQGNYSGDPGNPVGVHLHFSIVKDDPGGNFMNELEIKNTIDPTPYFGMRLNANENNDDLAVCIPELRTPPQP